MSHQSPNASYHSSGNRNVTDPLPSFCDASSTVSASTFAARRLFEVKSLYRHVSSTFNASPSAESSELPGPTVSLSQLVETSAGSTGRKRSSRHLRRRATSHVGSRKRHRYPDGINQGQPQTAHCRRARRKPQQMQRAHSQWCWDTPQLVVGEPESAADEADQATIDAATGRGETPGLATADAASSSCGYSQTSTVHWIPTHIWHAKRFRMQTLWHWQVPIMHGQRGAAAALRLLQQDNKTLIQDVTWSMQPWCWRIGTVNSQNEYPGGHSSFMQALGTILKRIVPDWSMPSSAYNLKDPSYLDGMLHEMDMFPHGTIGPVRCCVALGPLIGQDDGVDLRNHEKCYFIYFWAHPSIQKQLFDQLSRVVEQTTLPESFRSSILQRHAMGCIRLRGKTVHSCLKSTMLAMAAYNRTAEADAPGTCENEVAAEEFMEGATQKLFLKLRSSSNHMCSTTLVIIPSASQIRETMEHRNGPIDSMDLLCTVRHAKDLFLHFVLHGAACPIGIVEEAHLLLEAKQPVLLFPRDYPDTVEGETYWKSLEDDWGYVRRHLEGGSGRVRRTGSRKPRLVDWLDLVDRKDGVIVAMRGSFGKVLWNTLQTAGNIPQCVKGDNERGVPGNKKRRYKLHSILPRAPALAKAESARHTAICTSLIDSLALPAVIVCHWVIVGKGSARPGAKIVEDGNQRSRSVLGYVTSASFSSSQGVYRGLAVCGVARWLNAVSMAKEDGTLLMTSTARSSKEIVLQVCLVGENVSELATGYMSLLL